MSRYANEFASVYTPDQIHTILGNFFAAEGFKPCTYKGELAYKKGQGWATAPQYIKITQNGSMIRVEAFIKYAILPGVYVGEMGLKGFFGAVPKSFLGTRVSKLENALLGRS